MQKWKSLHFFSLIIKNSGMSVCVIFPLLLWALRFATELLAIQESTLRVTVVENHHKKSHSMENGVDHKTSNETFFAIFQRCRTQTFSNTVCDLPSLFCHMSRCFTYKDRKKLLIILLYVICITLFGNIIEKWRYLFVRWINLSLYLSSHARRLI